MDVRLFARTSLPFLKSAGYRPSAPGALSRSRVDISHSICVVDGGLVLGPLDPPNGCVGDQLNCSLKYSAHRSRRRLRECIVVPSFSHTVSLISAFFRLAEQTGTQKNRAQSIGFLMTSSEVTFCEPFEAYFRRHHRHQRTVTSMLALVHHCRITTKFIQLYLKPQSESKKWTTEVFKRSTKPSEKKLTARTPVCLATSPVSRMGLQGPHPERHTTPTPPIHFVISFTPFCQVKRHPTSSLRHSEGGTENENRPATEADAAGRFPYVCAYMYIT
ncbi:hypothetical protein CSKR_103519 [Clonorchis sinensis]|uniref:Uncharacterized protein n=1 Tax=Clonorchis sinensis TaxID=79923 RepID=A0A3R7JJM7_CLOSI|nr:hypothetical protein CSKR_103519 [Clonorchis sinensis]